VSVRKEMGGAACIWQASASTLQKDVPALQILSLPIGPQCQLRGLAVPSPSSSYFPSPISFFYHFLSIIFIIVVETQRISPPCVGNPRGGTSGCAARDRMVQASGLPRKALTLEGLLLGGATFGSRRRVQGKRDGPNSRAAPQTERRLQFESKVLEDEALLKSGQNGVDSGVFI
jgi:hypothetical protein